MLASEFDAAAPAGAPEAGAEEGSPAAPPNSPFSKPRDGATEMGATADGGAASEAGAGAPFVVRQRSGAQRPGLSAPRG